MATSALAAQQLGMSRSALYRRLQHYGVRELAAPPRVHWSLEQAVLGLTLLGGLPAAVALAWIVWGQNYSFEVRWTLAAVVLVVWIGCGAAAYQMVTRVLYLAANLLGALHEGDYSIRGDRARSRAAPPIS